MPCYNAAATVEKAVRSVQAQTVTDWELLVVDDASQDASSDIVSKITASDSRIQLLRLHKNRGAAGARNAGIARAQGGYIAFCDSDDFWNPEKLQKQLLQLEASGAGLCCTAYRLLPSKPFGTEKIYHVPAYIDYAMMLLENHIGCSTVLVCAKALPTPAFDNRFFHEDYALWLKILRSGQTAVGIDEALVDYSPGGKSSDKIKAARHRYDVYRRGEEFSVVRSLGLLARYARRALAKHAP